MFRFSLLFVKKQGVRILSILTILFIFFLTVISRTYKLSFTPIYPDEITWMVRSKETALAIRTFNFNYFKNAWWSIKDNTEALSIPMVASVGFPIIYLAKGQSILSYNLFQDYIVGRYVVIIFTGCFIVTYYYFISKYFSKKVAILTSVLLLLDPIFVANSKLIMNDIFLTGFIFLSLASYLLIKERRVSIIFSSLGLAAAFLTKPNGILVIPVFFLQIFLNRKHWRDELSKFATTLIVSFILIFIFWPAMWHNWLLAIPEYLLRQSALVGGGINNYFLGKITNNPPFYYYLFLIFVRIPPLIILGFVVYWIKLLRDKKRTGWKLNFAISSAIFLLIFLAVISISPKKLDVRYALPVWPWIYLFSGTAFVNLLEKYKKLYRVLFYCGITLYFSAIFVYFFPHHDLYYNFLVGGSKNAYKYNLMGICSGSKEAVDYISKCYPEARDLAVLGCGRSTVAYYYPYPINYDWKNEDFFIVENYFLQLEKDREVVEFYRNNKPTHTIKVNGVNLVEIYVRGEHKNICEGGG